MKNKGINITLLVILILVVGGCLYLYQNKKKNIGNIDTIKQTNIEDGRLDVKQNKNIQSLQGTWRLTAFNSLALEPKQAQITITSNGDISGTMPCSTFSGKVTITLDSLNVLFKVNSLSVSPVLCTPKKEEKELEEGWYSSLQRDFGLIVTRSNKVPNNKFELNNSEFSFEFTSTSK